MPGDYHAIELPFVFDNAKPTTRHVFTPKEQQLSDLITQYWTNFTAHADPNVGAPYVWPRYTAAGDESIQLEMPPRTTTGLYRSQCDFWETHYQKYYFD
jgi:para-nitrobenzyl esterase